MSPLLLGTPLFWLACVAGAHADNIIDRPRIDKINAFFMDSSQVGLVVNYKNIPILQTEQFDVTNDRQNCL
jgi:hypothetical protein